MIFKLKTIKINSLYQRPHGFFYMINLIKSI